MRSLVWARRSGSSGSFAPEAAVLLKAAFDPFETSATASNYKSAYAVASGRCVDAAGQFMP